MRPHVLIASLTACLFAAEAPREDPSRRDLEQMQGSWQCASYTVDGMRLPEDTAQAMFRTVKGDGYTIFRFEKVIGKGTIKLDATKNPREIDAMTAATPTRKGGLIRGIYEVSDDTLRLCFGAPGKERPREFKSEPGSGHTLTTWAREKR
jgi:uncharacterized protein (TIGR03067 family)